MRKKARSKKANAKSRRTARSKKSRKRSGANEPVLDRRVAAPNSGTQSGDLQGLRDVEGADSESVNELLEEGNAFEAGAVAGVEQADDNEEREVHAREVPEDDVPGEYLDKE